MTIVSVPGHDAARVICRVLKLRRVTGSWKSPTFADSQHFATADTVLFVNEQTPRGRRSAAQRCTTDILWAYMLGRAASVSRRPLIGVYLGPAQNASFTPPGSRSPTLHAALPAAPATSAGSRSGALPSSPPTSAQSDIAATPTAGSLWLANRVEDRQAGQCYYPDMLVNPGLREVGVIGSGPGTEADAISSATGTKAAGRESSGPGATSAISVSAMPIPDRTAPLLVDPQAAAFCRTAFAFLPPNRIACCELLASTPADETAPTEQQAEMLARLAAELALIAVAGTLQANESIEISVQGGSGRAESCAGSARAPRRSRSPVQQGRRE